MLVFSIDISSTTDVNIDYSIGYDNTVYLSMLCKEGALVRWLNIDDCIQQRLDYELDIIHKNGLEKLFLILMDSIQYAKTKGIYLGPERGVLSTSAVAYALGITDIDPFKYDFLFERYFTSWKASMEIWIDVDLSRQNEVIDYVNEKYNQCISPISICVSDNENVSADMYEKDIILESLRNIYRRTGENVDINAIDYSNRLVFECIEKEYFSDSSILSRYRLENSIFEKKINSMDDYFARICLDARIDDWVNNEKITLYVKACASNKSIVDCKKYKELTKNTYGLLLYQEQIIHIFEDIGGFSPEQANEARRCLCKRAKIKNYQDKFIYGCEEEGISGCLSMGFTKEIGEEIYAVTANMAGYCITKAGIVVEAMLIYQFVWLECYYPDDVKRAMTRNNTIVKDGEIYE